MNDSQWVQKRRRLVEDFVQGITLLPALLADRKLATDTILAMRDEIKALREAAETAAEATRRADDDSSG
jgi:hypothetical protein